MVLKNQPYTENISGKTYTFKTVAKASTSTQNFKFRLKVTDNSDLVSYTLISDALNLTTNYQLFEYTCDVPLNTKEVEFQVLCGAKTGIYYFDNFNAITSQTLSVANEENPLLEKVVIYPNPAKNKVFVKSNMQIANIQLFSFTGLQLNCKLTHENTIDVSHLNNGFYILNIHFNNGAQKSTKLFINN
ncbi:MAG: hypothetical protein ABS28_04125 [Cryomorphaceae bacterium BACL22 MAG-120619-bin32]|nr:MAG: hypothetical protein ABS28_04125 [Cryomorphaceae bacterium BACL22 MAG-120619-bin32]